MRGCMQVSECRFVSALLRRHWNRPMKRAFSRQPASSTGTRLVPCPCCGKSVHHLLINDHLETCGLVTKRRTTAPEAVAATPPSVEHIRPLTLDSSSRDGASHDKPDAAASSSRDGASHGKPDEASSSSDHGDPRDGAPDQDELVRCPICAAEMPLRQIDAHLDEGCGLSGGRPDEEHRGASSSDGGAGIGRCDAGGRDCGGSSASDAVGMSQPEASQADSSQSSLGESSVHCPICLVQMSLAQLNDHLDAGGCGDAPEPVRAAPQGQRTRPEAARMDDLAQEMRCSICFELYDNPHSLPCQHSFCYECVMGCFRATRKMECPLCKAPVWKRQLTTNHTLAGIVKAFVSLQQQSEGT